MAPLTWKEYWCDKSLTRRFESIIGVTLAVFQIYKRRRLILAVRETPLHKGHLELMCRVADLGGIILPPVPAFYFGPRTIEELIDHSVGKILDLIDIDHSLFKRWEGEHETRPL